MDHKTTFFLSRYDDVLRCVRKYAQAPEQIEDIVQQIYIEYKKQTIRPEDESTATGLLFGIAKNTAINHLRDRYRHSPERIRQVAEQYIARTLQDESPLEEETIREKVEALNDCIEKLNPKSFSLIRQHYWEKKTLRTLSQVLNTDEKNLSKVLCRIRLALKDCIQFKLKQNDHFD